MSFYKPEMLLIITATRYLRILKNRQQVQTDTERRIKIFSTRNKTMLLKLSVYKFFCAKP